MFILKIETVLEGMEPNPAFEDEKAEITRILHDAIRQLNTDGDQQLTDKNGGNVGWWDLNGESDHT